MNSINLKEYCFEQRGKEMGEEGKKREDDGYGTLEHMKMRTHNKLKEAMARKNPVPKEKTEEEQKERDQ